MYHCYICRKDLPIYLPIENVDLTYYNIFQTLNSFVKHTADESTKCYAATLQYILCISQF